MATTPVPTTLGSTTAAPTTTATTAAPTTTATTLAPTTTLTTLAPTTLPPDIDIDSEPITIYITSRHVVTLVPGPPIDHKLDQDLDAGAITITLSQEGANLNTSIPAGAIPIVMSLVGTPIQGVAISDGLIDLSISIKGDQYLENKPCSFVMWSKIGSLDFTLDKTNVAGKMPMPWNGCTYNIMKLGNKVVVYGQNGVAFMFAKDNVWGVGELHQLGLYSRRSVTGSKYNHYFIDIVGKLYEVSEQGLNLLDYSEYLSQMGSIIMTMDSETGLIHICDGVYGYVYSPNTKSFGEGPINITGIGSQNGTLYVVSPAEIETPKFDIITDIYDFNSRSPKTVKTIELGTDLTEKLRVKVLARHQNNVEFRESNWALVNPSGTAYVPMYGIEFKLRIASDIYEYLGLDYIRVLGDIHGYNYLNSVR